MSNEDLKVRFFDAAAEILATDGYGGLKLAAVCKHLEVTTGAFYHAFGSWSEFTTEFLHNWRRERTTLIVELTQAEKDPVAQLEGLLAATLELRHGSEAAIRVWSSIDPVVGEVQRRVDAEREAVVLGAMQLLVGKREAEKYARWGLNILIGFEVATGDQTGADLEWQLREVLDIAVSRSAERKAARRRTA